ncbi:UBX domain-containing protein 4 [Wickerhamomyces ciferrii]|uniref:UBX domain-containing protein 4 n=1 Tax=Wickerhamomyces ciferrii (strain ATCC 14091 / BCRC 22168 / CBS 111 / JCM 3599 / NBRC 0793 / NRRL Y-1031 F-60-10) TaxID=1206466 RepID=K0KEI8_WICCF|nr:UBX domain-containing protein 4 [Wickerhamomyces ciferrii]CCH40647.1 UBX domain-containing protein 4 [Wickerhamomyces ciferrii]
MTDLDSVFISTVETAVTTSVAQNKPLIVFNTDNSTSSNNWINEILSSDLLQLVSEKAVALKLVKDTQQFALFEQVFPNVIVPSIYCIKVSAILDIIHGDVNKEQFKERMEKVLLQNSSNSTDQQDQQPPNHVNLQESGITSNTRQTTSSPQQNTTVRNAPLEDSNVSLVSPSLPATDASGSTDSPRVGNSTRDALQSQRNTPSPSSKGKSYGKRDHKSLKEEAAELAAKKYKEEQLKKRQMEKEERDRVKRLLKADEDERKLNELRKKEDRERQRRLSNDSGELEDEHSNIDEIISGNKSLKNNIRDRRPSSHPKCALSIRLLDGSSLRHEFQNNDTLNVVRKWLDENRTDGDDPYCFHRTIPRATFGVTDEEKTLDALELTPRSALILKPFNTYATAYQGKQKTPSSGGLFSRVFGGLSSLWYGSEGHSLNNSNDEARQNDSIEQDDDMIDPASPQSSSYVSPAPTPRNFNEPETNRLDLLHPSSLNLNLNLDQVQLPRPASPAQSLNTQQNHQESAVGRTELPASLLRTNSSQSWIRTLNDDNDNDDRLTYNGNHVNLEDDSKKR